MKKSNPTRKHPLKRTAIKRGKSQLKRSGRMKPKSAKRRKEDQQDNDLADFAGQFLHGSLTPLCWLCRDAWATQVHHIAGRSSKERHKRGGLFACCTWCHDEILPGMSLRAQFKLKQRRDPEGYDADLAKRLQAAKNGGRLDA